MLNIVTVLKSGGEYMLDHVRELREQLRAAGGTQFIFWCLTDQAAEADHAGFNAIRLGEGWPGWWSKIELFAAFDGDLPLLYLDLDTRIVGALHDIAMIARRGRFTMLSDFYRLGDAASGLMAWRGGDLRAIYARFREDPARWMRQFAEGDQGFIKDCILRGYVPQPDRWQEELPGQVISYKVHVQGRASLPPDARVVCFHGQPRPWTVTLPPKQQEAA